MSFPVAKHGQIVVIAIDDHLVVGNRQALKRLVLDELARGERFFRLDFGRSRYVDSSGLGVLVAIAKSISQASGTLVLANLDEDLKTLFVLTKLDTLFQFDDARRADAAPAPAPLADAPLPLRATSAPDARAGSAPPPA